MPHCEKMGGMDASGPQTYATRYNYSKVDCKDRERAVYVGRYTNGFLTLGHKCNI